MAENKRPMTAEGRMWCEDGNRPGVLRNTRRLLVAPLIEQVPESNISSWFLCYVSFLTRTLVFCLRITHSPPEAAD